MNADRTCTAFVVALLLASLGVVGCDLGSGGGSGNESPTERAISGSAFGFMKFTYTGQTGGSAYSTGIRLAESEAQHDPPFNGAFLGITLRDSSDSPEIDEGEYTFDTTQVPGTWSSVTLLADLDSSSGEAPYGATTRTQEEYESDNNIQVGNHDQIVGGTVNVSRSGAEFRIEWTFETSDGGTLTGNYTGGVDETENTAASPSGGVGPVPFVFTVQTDLEGASDDNQFTIPVEWGTFLFQVDWGDGSVDTGVDDAITHSYDAPGEYDITISGTFPHLQFPFETANGDAGKLVDVKQWGTNQWGTTRNMFRDCVKLEAFSATDVPDLSGVTQAYAMFSGASSFDDDLGDWDVSTLESIQFMFSGATDFNGDISSWNVGNVQNMTALFQNAESFAGDLSSWDVSSVSEMSSMFSNATAFNGNIGDWDVSSVTDMLAMFSGATAFNSDLAEWDVAAVTTMEQMFGDAQSFNKEIGDWDVSSVTNMHNMFSGATSFNQDISRWDVSSVIGITEPVSIGGMDSMFRDAVLFNQDLSSWNVRNVTGFSFMFMGASAFESDLAGWNVGSATNMRYMFSSAESFSSDLGVWDISNVTDMSSMLILSGMTTADYSATLIGWEAAAGTPNGLTLGAHGLTFNADASAARQNLVEDSNWTIEGDSQES